MPAALAALVLGSGCETVPLWVPGGPIAEWPSYGDAGGTRYSPLTQINRGNVRRLEVAWIFRTGEDPGRMRSGSKAAFEATPIMVDGTLYLSTPTGRVIALDPEHGTERWTFDPQIDLSVGYSELTSRGVSTWLDSQKADGEPMRHRIFLGTIDARLIALDAATGLPCGDFGTDGEIDLRHGVRPGSNLYANCVVALRASTGEVVWHFQLVHHDLWDYNTAAQPTLVDLELDGARIPAVIAAGKMGYVGKLGTKLEDFVVAFALPQ